MMNFFFDNIGYFAAGLPVVFGLAWWIAARGTKATVVEQGLDKRLRLALLCSLRTSNEGQSWNLKGE